VRAGRGERGGECGGEQSGGQGIGSDHGACSGDGVPKQRPSGAHHATTL
jgi:hypothetical protein